MEGIYNENTMTENHEQVTFSKCLTVSSVVSCLILHYLETLLKITLYTDMPSLFGMKQLCIFVLISLLFNEILSSDNRFGSKDPSAFS